MLEWTGERYIPDSDPEVTGAEIHYEHLHRYAFASQFVSGKKVLDLASGEGYGCFILSEKAQFVVGIEIDEKSVTHAQQAYPKKNIEFRKGSILNIPIEGEKIFDVIVCFEAIEHINEHDILIQEIKRLLKNDGLLIISTPNKQNYSDETGYHNPFHKKELYYPEFLELLRNHFSSACLFGQKVIVGSSIFPLAVTDFSLYSEFTIEQEDNRFNLKGKTGIYPLYFVAIASNIELNKNKMQKSYLIDKSNAIVTLLNKRINKCSTLVESLEQEKTKKDQQLLELNVQSDEITQRLVSRNKEISDLSSQIQEYNIKISDLSSQIQEFNIEISDLSSQIQEYNIKIRSLENLIETQNGRIEALNKGFSDTNIHAYGLEQLLFQREIQIKSLKDQVRQISLHAQGLEQIIREDQWNLRLQKRLTFLGKIINPCRNFFILGKKACNILLHEGLKDLIRQYNERKHIKKFEREHNIKLPVKDEIVLHKENEIHDLVFPEHSENPDVSIVIPVHNQLRYTLNCLNSILKKTQGSYEIVVVDDASSDSTAVTLKNIKNITIIQNEKNQGFIRSCNTGASACRGKYILFLNNDTIVTENWLPPLLEVINRENVGVVGSKLIYPDGRLQEAGSIIWNDASGWNYGRGDNPEKPEYNFLRPVDYCSGAALLVRKEIFEEAGGFDERYIPAYYEDADLCFSIRKSGYKVMYQPKSVVVHFEGISNGIDVNAGVKHNQAINKDKFFQRWKDILQKEHLDPDPANVFSARSRSSGKTILVIDQYVPFFDRDAGSQRMSNILKILADLGHKVTFIGDNFNHFDPYDSIMQQAGVEVIYFPFLSSIEQYLNLYGKYYEIVILSRPHIVEKHIAHVRKYCTRAKVVYDTVDLQFIRESRRAEVLQDPGLTKKVVELKKWELKMAKGSDATLVVCTNEQQILIKEDPSLNVHVISLIHDVVTPEKNFSERKNIMFLGAFLHNPNADGVLWFIKEIFPKIILHIPDVRFFVVGDRPTDEISSLSSGNIIVTGYIEDVSAYLNTCRVFVAPLRYGAGVKGKINHSMSHGLPVVTTSVGAEGLDLTDNENVLIADDPDTFSRKVIQLYNDEFLWNKLSKNSIAHIQRNFSYEQSKKRIQLFIDSLNQI